MPNSGKKYVALGAAVGIILAAVLLGVYHHTFLGPVILELKGKARLAVPKAGLKNQSPNAGLNSVELFGWVPPEEQPEEVRKEATALHEALPDFQVVGAEDSRGKVVRFWDVSLKLLGRHLPTYRQEIGDCVSMGTAKGVDYLQLIEIANGESEEYHPAYQPYIYGISRVQIGKGRLRGDGSLGIWAVQGVRDYGVLRADAEGVPPYAGRVAKQWGANPGPPKEFIDVARENPVQTYAPVKGYEDVRDAIVNGYPVIICSGVGFTGGKFERNGRIFLRPGGSWAHCMVIIAVDDSIDPGAVYIQNSWGENAHPMPIDGAPAGGFWAERAAVDKICSSWKDSFAISGFKGFPARNLDWNVIGQRKVRWTNRMASLRRLDQIAAENERTTAHVSNYGSLYAGLTVWTEAISSPRKGADTGRNGSVGLSSYWTAGRNWTASTPQAARNGR